MRSSENILRDRRSDTDAHVHGQAGLDDRRRAMQGSSTTLFRSVDDDGRCFRRLGRAPCSPHP
jgi:hypothetical protein